MQAAAVVAQASEKDESDEGKHVSTSSDDVTYTIAARRPQRRYVVNMLK
jgi:hypothetical protein